MATETGGLTAGMHERWLIPAVCLAQLALISLPVWRYGEVVPVITVSLIVVSGIALFTSVTSALLYLCFIASVISSEFYEDHLMLPGNLHFCEALFLVVWGVAFVAWLQERRLGWRRTRLDRPMLVFLGLVVASIGLGLFYGQDVRQVMRDVRYPLYYVLFFRRNRVFRSAQARDVSGRVGDLSGRRGCRVPDRIRTHDRSLVRRSLPQGGQA